MFISELVPIAKEIAQQPLAFMGGLFSGVFKLDISEDPLKSWLENQGVSTHSTSLNKIVNTEEGPQSISID
ncbi:MAG: hypothetical protein WA999_01185 [Spirulinaceae cyanobacterium]